MHAIHTTIMDIEEKAVEKGKKEGLLAAALGMKELQISTDQIVQATGLSAAEIDGIKAEDID